MLRESRGGCWGAVSRRAWRCFPTGWRERGTGDADEVRYWSASRAALRDAQGTVAFVLQHTVDVTEVKRTEEAVRQAAGISLPPTKGVRSGVLGRAEQVQAANEVLCTEQQRLHALLEQAPGFRFLRGAVTMSWSRPTVPSWSSWDSAPSWAGPFARPFPKWSKGCSSCSIRCGTPGIPSSAVRCA